VVLYKDKAGLDDIQKTLRFVNGWDFYYSDWTEQDGDELATLIHQEEIHYILCASEPDKSVEQLLNMIRAASFILGQIYYNSSARQAHLNRLSESGFSSIILGENRRQQLQDTLAELGRTYWRNIPEDFEGIRRPLLPPRAERILRYMESAPIRKITIEDLSRHIRISPSHLRKIFNDYFQMNFREFKQALLARYEIILLFEMHLKPGQIYEILDYKNLSAFSRSFKSRHGISWQNFNRSF